MKRIKKRYIALVVITFCFILGTNAQEANKKRPLDDKYGTLEMQVKEILTRDANYSPVHQNSNELIKTRGSQLTDNTVLDLELHAAINPTDSNNIVISWMKMEPSNSNMPLVFSTYYTTDFGNSWNEGVLDFIPRTIQANEALSGGGDPMIVFDTNGNVYISWIYTIVRVVSQEEIYVDVYLTYAKSTDKGATWVRPDNGEDLISSGTLNYAWGSGITGVNTGNFPDKQWFGINPTNNDLFVSLAEFNTTDNYNTGIDTWGVRRKPANSTIFDEKVIVPPLGTVWGQLGSIAIDKNGNIHTVYPYYPAFPDPPLEKLMHSVSVNNGVSYSTPHFISDVDVTYFQGVGQENTTSTGMYDRMYPSSYIAIDTSSTSPFEGRLYTVWNSNNASYNKMVEILISYSDDNGTTWTTPRVVNSDPPRNYGFHHHPTISVNPDGKIVLGWFDNRGYEVPDVYMNDYYIAVSTDGGDSFLEQKISNEAFNYNDANFESSVGIGEYFQILASKNHILAFYTFFDGNDTEIYFEKREIDNIAIKVEEVTPVSNKIAVTISPNPAKNVININLYMKDKDAIDITILDISGKIVKNTTSKKVNKGDNILQINISDLKQGPYFALLKSKYGLVTKSFIKN